MNIPPARAETLIQTLCAIAGREHVITEADALSPYIHEMRGLMLGKAIAAVRPGSTQEVASIMIAARMAGVPLVAHGGNTGLVGGGLPDGGVVISLTRLNRIRAMDTVNATMTVEAGVILKLAQDAAAEAGRYFPLSLGSEGSCTIGGNISTNAGGTAVLRYGNMRDLVLGLEVVLPSGEIWNGLSGLRKDNAGYDLKHLFIGSEGTLGIITAAVLKLFPAPKSRSMAFCGMKSPHACIQLFERLRARAGERLSGFEILPRFGMELVLRHASGIREPLADSHPFYAMIELTAPESDAPLEDLLGSVLEASLEAGEIDDATLSASEAQALMFWRIREQLSDCQRFEGGSIKHDVSVPISSIADFLDVTSARCEAEMAGIRVCAFGHIGDGNIHFNLSQPIGMDKQAFLDRWHDFNAIVHEEVLKRSGSIAAEHGVGLFKRDELPHYKDPVALSLMATLKRALDPDNLLNPGKIIALGDDLPVFKPSGM